MRLQFFKVMAQFPEESQQLLNSFCVQHRVLTVDKQQEIVAWMGSSAESGDCPPISLLLLEKGGNEENLNKNLLGLILLLLSYKDFDLSSMLPV